MPCLFVDNLTTIDCSILDPDRGLIGASWSVDIELLGELDEQSMVFDFSRAKRTIKEIIDQQVDHKLLVPTDYRGLVISGEQALEIEFTDRQQQKIIHHSPASAVCGIATSRINQKSVIEFLQPIMRLALPANVQSTIIKLREETQAGNYYRYSHGLKKHDGNCQRIAHGHRSQIQIWQNGERAEKLEQDIAAGWHDIYLGTAEDVVARHHQRIRFAYQTEQGSFMLELPENRVYLIPDDSTVECIAAHIHALVSSRQPGTKIKVKAFEGIGKGAIA